MIIRLPPSSRSIHSIIESVPFRTSPPLQMHHFVVHCRSVPDPGSLCLYPNYSRFGRKTDLAASIESDPRVDRYSFIGFDYGRIHFEITTNPKEQDVECVHPSSNHIGSIYCHQQHPVFSHRCHSIRY